MTLFLSNERCVACEGGIPPLSHDEAAALLAEVPGWTLSEDSKAISRSYQFKNFVEALAFVNRVGSIAEGDGHHPDIHLTDYRNVRIVISTHAIKGLSRNDFIVASKIDA